MGPHWKPSRTARKIAQTQTRLDRQSHERREKALARRRDRFCRFPLCGCRRLGLATEVSHQVHKSQGGNPAGDRSRANGLILLCRHRHQDGAVSRHAGTLRAVALTPEGMNGPIAWEVDASAVYPELKPFETGWFEIAREEGGPQHWLLFTAEQRAALELLAEMRA